MEEYDSNANFTALISNLTSEDRLLARVFIIHARYYLPSTSFQLKLSFFYVYIELKIQMNYYL